MPRDLLRVIRWLVLLLVLFAFAAVVWPTPYRYDHVSLDGDVYPVRINRVTGDADMLTPDDGWVPMGGDSDTPQNDARVG